MKIFCSKCGKEYKLEPDKNLRDFQCECGGDLQLKDLEKKPSTKPDNTPNGGILDMMKQRPLIISAVVILVVILGIVFIGAPMFNDLTVTNVTAPSSGEKGKEIVVPYSIKNNGIFSSGGFNITFTLTADKKFNNSQYLGKVRIVDLAAGETKEQNARLTIPANTTPGNYYIRVWIDPGKAIPESDRTNNIKYSPTQIKIN